MLPTIFDIPATRRTDSLKGGLFTQTSNPVKPKIFQRDHAD